MKQLNLILAVGLVALSFASSADIPNHPNCPVYKPTDNVVIFKHPDCTKFYLCSDKQVATEKDCPGGTEFNYKLMICVYPEGFCH